MKSFGYTKILGWSVSRYDVFKTCRRQYFYQYYGKFDREYNLLEINSLKNLTSVPLEIGNIIHDVFATLLKRLQKTLVPLDEEKFREYARELARKQVAAKEFAEVFYGERHRIDADTDLFPKIETALMNFLHSERFRWLFDVATATREQWIIEPPGFGECRINDLKAYCKVDFLFPISDELMIFDWKTGRSTLSHPGGDKHARQMQGYMIWAHFQFERAYEKIKPVVAYLLPEYYEREVSAEEFAAEEFGTLIRTQTEEMYELCADIEENIPKPKFEFEMTDDTSACRFCNFRELCGRS